MHSDVYTFFVFYETPHKQKAVIISVSTNKIVNVLGLEGGGGGGVTHFSLKRIHQKLSSDMEKS